MKQFSFLVAFCCITIAAIAQKQQYRPAIVGFYNLENLYDTINNPMVNDEEFLPNSVRNYNTAIYMDKLSRLADVISQLGTEINPEGIAVLGVAEIENDTVLNDLVKQPAIANRNLRFVHYDSPDLRGVDVGLLYNPKYFSVLYSQPYFVQLPGGSKDAFTTRDILYVKGMLGPDTLHIFVNHWPSRSGGEARSRPARAAAAGVVKKRIDSLMAISPNTKVVLMGDLNDDPVSPSLTEVIQAKGRQEEIKPGGMYNPWTDMYRSCLLYTSPSPRD